MSSKRLAERFYMLFPTSKYRSPLSSRRRHRRKTANSARLNWKLAKRVDATTVLVFERGEKSNRQSFLALDAQVVVARRDAMRENFWVPSFVRSSFQWTLYLRLDQVHWPIEIQTSPRLSEHHIDDLSPMPIGHQEDMIGKERGVGGG